jgi:predicted transcriptional regulator
MTDIILSIHPEWAKKIYSGEKTVEVRRTRPSIESFSWLDDPLIYLYETAPVQKITGFVFVKGFTEIQNELLRDTERFIATSLRKTCLSDKELRKYANGKTVYFWELKDPFKLPVPQEIKGTVPQSWRYATEENRI